MRHWIYLPFWLVTALVQGDQGSLARSGSKAEYASLEFGADPVLKEHLVQLSKKVPEGFTIIVQPPFVVLGDESPETVRRRATHTVKWAVDKLKQDYFQRDPL